MSVFTIIRAAVEPSGRDPILANGRRSVIPRSWSMQQSSSHLCSHGPRRPLLRSSRAPASHLVVVVCLVAVMAAAADAQVIAAPDKVDELEERAYAEGQARLALDMETREPRTTIDINVYTCVALTAARLEAGGGG
jgi:hypothetical protein